MQDEEKELDDFLRKVVREAGLESPPTDFTKNVVSKIEKEKKYSTSYRPLISRPAWGVLAVVLTGLITYIFLAKVDTSIGWLEQLEVSLFPEHSILESLSTITLPSTLLYAIAALAVFVYIQIFLLKSHWNKKHVLY